MEPGKVFLVRAVLSLAAGYIISQFYFARTDLYSILLLAALMMFAAYVFEALRRARK